MQQQPQPNQGSWTPIEDAKTAFSFLAFASQVLAHPVEVFLRRGFGSQYFGIAALVSFFAVPMWMLFFPGESPAGIMIFWVLWLVMQLRARIETTRMLAKGEVIHSRYNGTPRLTKAFKSMPESRIKAAIEPLAVFLTALAVMQGRGVVLPPGTPNWITPDLVALTRRVWQKHYRDPLTVQDAVTIVLNTGHLIGILARE